jgi:hypothetical protein
MHGERGQVVFGPNRHHTANPSTKTTPDPVTQATTCIATGYRGRESFSPNRHHTVHPTPYRMHGERGQRFPFLRLVSHRPKTDPCPASEDDFVEHLLGPSGAGSLLGQREEGKDADGLRGEERERREGGQEGRMGTGGAAIVTKPGSHRCRTGGEREGARRGIQATSHETPRPTGRTEGRRERFQATSHETQPARTPRSAGSALFGDPRRTR